MNDIDISRGKRKDNGEWVTGYLLSDTAPCRLKAEGKCTCAHDGSQTYILAWEDVFHEYVAYEIDHETKGKCTGLRDKNDTLIFEGDIVQFAIFNYEGTDSQCEGVIKWSNAMWEIWKSVDFEYYGSNGAFALGHIDAPDAEIKVIGNIYDDPELLQGSVGS